MGGMGSGRGYQGGKERRAAAIRSTCGNFNGLALLTASASFGWHWSRNGEQRGIYRARAEGDRVTLSYSHKSSGGDWQAMDYPVRLEWTDCTLGGRRAWFLCPANGCGRRVALLYLGGAGIFACRHCYRLAYACQRETADDRAMRRADNIRERLGWQAGIANPSGGKPKGMHWRTFERLTAEHDAFVGVSLAGMAARLNLMERRLDGMGAALYPEG
jgi:hypothetical protein